MTETAQTDWIVLATRAEGLMGKLARYPGPAFRKAYLSNLMASGSRLSVAKDARAAAYCFDKVAEALKDIADETESEMTPETSGPDSTTSAPRAPGRKPKKAVDSPLDILKHQWRKDRLLDAEAVLRRQGGRLSPLENKIYREKLDKLRVSDAAGEKTAAKSVSKVDAILLDLRRQLYRRVLKSQKVSLRRKAMPATALRQAFLLPGTSLPESAGASPNTNPASSMALPESPSQARPTGFQTIIGPYNDRYNLGDMLTLMAQADATWVEEFLDLYKGLADLKGLVTALPNQAKK